MQHQEIACNNMSLQRKKMQQVVIAIIASHLFFKQPMKHEEFECSNTILHATTGYCIGNNKLLHV